MDITPTPPTAVLQHSHLVYHPPPPRLPSHTSAAHAHTHTHTHTHTASPTPMLARAYRYRLLPTLAPYAASTSYPRSPFISSFSSHPLPSTKTNGAAAGTSPGSHGHGASAWPPRYVHPHEYGHGRYHPSPPPEDGSSPISALPDELLVSIMSQMEWDELFPLRLVCRRWSELTLSPSLHASLTLLSLPPVPLPLLLETRILPSVRHLHLHLFPYPSLSRPSTPPTSALLALLGSIPPTQLLSLSLPFSAPYLHGDEVGDVLKRAGGRLEVLDLRGSGLVGGRWLDWLGHVGTKGRGLTDLDLGFTGITDLPVEAGPPDSHHSHHPSPRPGGEISLLRLPDPRQPPPFSQLRYLSLASCAHLPPSVLASFLANLPASLERLDLSRLDQVTFAALWGLRVVLPHSGDLDLYCSSPDASVLPVWAGREEEGQPTPTRLREIKVVGIDQLTRRDIRDLKRHWEAQRRACYPALASLWLAREVKALKPRVMGVPRTPSPPPPPARALPSDDGLEHAHGLHEGEDERGLGPSREASPSSSSTLSTPSPRLLTPSSSIGTSPPRNLKLHPLLHGLQLPLSPSPVSLPYTSSPAPLYGVTLPPSAIPGAALPPPAYPDQALELALDTLERLKINIMHSAILESEDEAGYRQFIGEVAGGVVPPSPAAGRAGMGVGEMSMDLLING